MPECSVARTILYGPPTSVGVPPPVRARSDGMVWQPTEKAEAHHGHCRGRGCASDMKRNPSALNIASSPSDVSRPESVSGRGCRFSRGECPPSALAGGGAADLRSGPAKKPAPLPRRRERRGLGSLLFGQDL